MPIRPPALAACLAACLAAVPAAAGPPSEARAVEDVQRMLDDGHWTTCSLERRPVERGGYFRCLDVGPYRFVEEYGATGRNEVVGYVTMGSASPVRILAGQPPAFLHAGPWQQDLPRRVAAHRARLSGEGAPADADPVGGAADFVTRFDGPPKESAAPAADPAAGGGEAAKGP